jgi:6-phosphogluconolactonase (cycloisomerase 2 family)
MSRNTSFRLGVYRLLVAALFIIPLFAGTAGHVSASGGDTGAVYTMTNASTGNAIQVFNRAADGTLTASGSFSTGGLGSGAGLGSQGAIVLSQDHRWLFAVNAGSNEISVFSVQSKKLKLVDTVSSHGSDPISLTVNHRLLYVLNAGDGGSIAGFKIASNGHLSFLDGSVRPLSNNGVGASPSPEEIGFTPDGNHLVVTEKGSNLIDTYNVVDGLAQGPVVNASSGPAPYGFGFGRHGVMVVSEAAQSAVSSYKVSDGGLSVISVSVLDTQAAACWLVVSDDGRFAYAANAASGTISGYRVSENGKLALLRSDGINGNTGAGSHPIDMSFSGNGQFLYVLASGNSTINAFAVNADGSLTMIASYSSPAGASGLAAR